MTLSKRILGSISKRKFVALDKFNRNIELVNFFKEHSYAPIFPKVQDLWRAVNASYLDGSAAFDYLEFGVWKGASMDVWRRLNENPKSRFFGFDSFEGLPEDWTPSRPKGFFGTDGQFPAIDDSRVQFIRGWFQQTLDGFLDGFAPAEKLVVCHDSDLYSSTLFALAKLDRIQLPGSVVMFDDFGDLLNQSRAWRDYIAAFGRKYKVFGFSSDLNGLAVVFD